MSIARSIKRVARLVPRPIRRLSFMQRFKRFATSHLLPHDWVYDQDYYANLVDPSAQRSAAIMAQSITDTFKPARVIDVGCGSGAMLEALRERGCTVAGLEKSTAALEICRRRNLDVRSFDLEHDSLPDKAEYDLVVSMEVAEHLPQRVDERYVQLLTGLGHTVVFTAAHPGQGGQDHINEQEPAYWIAKFDRHGFSHDPDTSRVWQQAWRNSNSVDSWYWENIMVFHRRAGSGG